MSESTQQLEQYLKFKVAKAAEKKEIESQITGIFKWECPLCGEEYESSEGDTLKAFTDQLFEDGVRWVSMTYMQGVFCKSCYTDPEIQESC